MRNRLPRTGESWRTRRIAVPPRQGRISFRYSSPDMAVWDRRFSICMRWVLKAPSLRRQRKRPFLNQFLKNFCFHTICQNPNTVFSNSDGVLWVFMVLKTRPTPEKQRWACGHYYLNFSLIFLYCLLTACGVRSKIIASSLCEYSSSAISTSSSRSSLDRFLIPLSNLGSSR